MNLKHVRTFVAVVEHGTVSSAAAHLRITQPALTRQIQSLQDEVGLKLFDHVNRRLALTSNGEEFLRHCRALVAQADAVLASAQSLGRGKTRRAAHRGSAADDCSLLSVVSTTL
jgi:DNA-binding transcriptional LysR family regulator